VKSQISRSHDELDNLQAKLRKMRVDKGVLKKSASAALQQVDVALSHTYLEEKSQHTKSLVALRAQFSNLEYLKRRLSFLQTGSSPALVLKADKQNILRASDAAQKGYNEEEKQILDLIAIERKKLQDVEDSMQDLQPAISNKLQQAMEINRTLAAATRAMLNDQDLLDIGTAKCQLIEESLGAQRKIRHEVSTNVRMASGLIEHMDTSVFLAKDVRGFMKGSSALVQLGSGHRRTFMDSSSVPSSPFLLLQGKDLSGARLQSFMDASESAGSSSNEGPFDKVTDMLSGLIATLKAEANEDVNQHQFCQDSLSENRRHRAAKVLSIDTLNSCIRWSKMGIVRLDEDLDYFASEMQRLTVFKKVQEEALAKEKKRVDKELTAHKLADLVIEKVVVILNQLCDLGDSAAVLMQDGIIKAKSGLRSGRLQTDRFSQCKEASKLMKSAHEKLKSLDSFTKQYADDYSHLSSMIVEFTQYVEDDTESARKATEAARAQRDSELATSQKDLSEAEKELQLIEEAERELEHSCSHIETHAERMAKREEEIKQLKEAYKVLDGEGIPV